MWRQDILLKPTETELLEEADCTHKLPGVRVGEGCWLEEHDSLWWQTQAKPHRLIFLGRVRTEPARQSFIFPLELVILILLQKPSSR